MIKNNHVSVDQLKIETRKYWNDKMNDGNLYIDNLLKKEILYWNQEKNNIPIKSKVDILVVLVGYSWEPLLISIYYYHPIKIIPILAMEYNGISGDTKGEDLKEYTYKLFNEKLIPNNPVFPDSFEVVEDEPKSIFHFLKKHVLPEWNQEKRIIIDVTGAKKSMVVGAYLFAAYVNCEVTYVDFKEYNQEVAKPWGYTCFIKTLSNPLNIFKIIDWNQVRHYYKIYNFDHALELVKVIQNGARDYFDVQDNQAIENLILLLDFYQTWAMGDFLNGKSKLNKIKENIHNFESPTVVEKLGTFWFDLDNFKESIEAVERGKNNLEDSIYNKDLKIIAYAANELANCERILKQGDNRSALLRAAGLFEFLIKIRIIKLWINNEFVVGLINEQGKPSDKIYTRVSIKNESNLENIPFKLEKIEEKLLKSASLPSFIRCLRWENTNRKTKNRMWIDKIGKNENEISIFLRINRTEILKEFWQNYRYTIDKDDFERKYDIISPYTFFETFRNKAIHFCLPIPEDVAKISIDLAKANFHDLKNNWLKIKEKMLVDPLPWSKVLSDLKINFIPNIEEVDKIE